MSDRSFVLAWYGGLLAGLLPILLLGFLYSALADRIVFVGWALVFATLWVLLLRHGMGAGWPAPRLFGALALLYAAAFAAFAALEKEHGEILDLGFRAVLPGIYHPNATAPRTAWGIAAAFAVIGAVAFGLGIKRRREAR